MFVSIHFYFNNQQDPLDSITPAFGIRTFIGMDDEFVIEIEELRDFLLSTQISKKKAYMWARELVMNLSVDSVALLRKSWNEIQ